MPQVTPFFAAYVRKNYGIAMTAWNDLSAAMRAKILCDYCLQVGRA